MAFISNSVQSKETKTTKMNKKIHIEIKHEKISYAWVTTQIQSERAKEITRESEKKCGRESERRTYFLALKKRIKSQALSATYNWTVTLIKIYLDNLSMNDKATLEKTS